MKIYNPNLDKKIVEKLESLDQLYFQFDKPIAFKGSLTIYPIIVSDYNEFVISSSCFSLNKNECIEGLKTTNLGYLIYKMSNVDGDELHNKDVSMWSQYFIKSCELIFHINYGVKCKKCGKVYNYIDFLKLISQKDGDKCACECGNDSDFDVNIKYQINKETKKHELIINDEILTTSDFDLLRQIVMYQNFPDYKDDSWVDPEIKKDHDRELKIRSGKNGMPTATLEKKIVGVCAKSPYKIEEIYNMKIKKFIILLETINDAMNYYSTRIGLMTGMVSMKEPVEHWLYKSEKSMYGSAVTSDDYQSKIKSANGG